VGSEVRTASFEVTGERDAAVLARAVLVVLFTYVFLANAWVGDDAYITYRVVWNFVNGHGLTFNPDERVQAYTHPLWMLVMSAAHVVTREVFFTGTAISWLFSAAALIVLVRWARTVALAALIVVWLISSKGFVDYTSSGLEYPLSYVLLAAFYTRYLSAPRGLAPSNRELTLSVLLAALAFLNRPDAVLLYAIPVGEAVVRRLREHPRDAILAVALGSAPAVLWLVFATVYYGFPLPNTYYAKVATSVPAFLVYRQGLAYVLNSISHDPVTLATVALALVAAVRLRGRPLRAALSAALYVLYTISVGGDFMSGRFFSMPFLVAVMVAAPALAANAYAAMAALVAYNVLVPLAPVKTTSAYTAAWPWRTQNGIKDERGYYHAGTNILFFSPFRDLPDFVWVREGTSFRSAPQKVTVQGSIGFYGYYAGPEKFLVDRNALSDPLLARLPVSPRFYFEFYAGHFFRDLPDGYLESVEHDRNALRDPLLREYYERLRNVTRGPVFRASRARDIVALNVGRFRGFHEVVEKRRPVALSIRADNERFITDVGERDPVAGTLVSSGRGGYLEYGPRIPCRRGPYRARWIGVAGSVPAAGLGYVEVWLDRERRIARQAVAAPADPASHVLAELDFRVPEDVRELDYRLFVHEGAQVTLERVELYSAHALPGR
jgi:arabinofuranosyltransferase